MGSLCDAAGYIAGVEDFGTRENNDIDDLAHAAAIVNWGKDFSRSSVHTAAIVRQARKNGARVLTLSPGGDGSDSVLRPAHPDPAGHGPLSGSRRDPAADR